MRWRARVDIALVAALALLAAYHLMLTLSTVLSYGLVHPLADEFRLSYRYLAMPFPDSIFALENGHRPVIPGLLRWIGLAHMGGSQAVQTVASVICAALSVALILREVRRGLPGCALPLMVAACLLSMSVLWDANARMFIHSNEAAHVFIVTLAVVAAIVTAMDAADSGRMRPWLAALACSIAATLSFGTGIACFGAVFVVALLGRPRPLLLGAIVAAAAATLAVYMYAMPGGDGVRNVVGTTSFDAAVLFSLMRLGAMFAEFTDAKPAAGAVGGVICVAFAVAVALGFARRAAFTRLQVFALALFAFAAGANLVIAASRAAYFFVYPEQVFADRYLYWSALLWMSMGLFVLASMRELPRRLEIVPALAVAALAVAAVLPAWNANDWARLTYEEVESAAAALRLGLHADSEIAPISDGGPAVAYRLVSELRRRRLADFSAAPGLRLGVRIPLELQPLPRLRLAASLPVQATPVPARRVTATLPRAMANSMGYAFWIADHEGRIVGAMARAGQTRYPRNAARLGVPRFDVLLGWVAAQATPPLLLVEPVAAGDYRAVAALDR